MRAPDHGESSGELFAAYVVEQLEVEEKRRASLESRGLAVITSSGTISGLLLAFAALADRREGLELSDDVTPWLIAALIAFVVAALLGVGLNTPSETALLIHPALLSTVRTMGSCCRRRSQDAAPDTESMILSECNAATTSRASCCSAPRWFRSQRSAF